MKKALSLSVFCLCIHLSAAFANAEILFKEDFEGSKPLSTYNEGKWTTIPHFTSSEWKNCLGILKDTTVPHSGRQCAKLYGDNGNWDTSEMYTGGTMNRTEFWVSWWERLSQGYHIDMNHKWFVFRLMNSNGSDDLISYTNFQCNNGGSDTTARMRIYSEPIDKLYGYANMYLPTNVWYRLKVYYKLNSPGLRDGIVGTWIMKSPNGAWQPWQSYRGIDIRGTAQSNIASVRIGGARSGYPSHGIKYIDDVVIATTEEEVERR